MHFKNHAIHLLALFLKQNVSSTSQQKCLSTQKYLLSAFQCHLVHVHYRINKCILTTCTLASIQKHLDALVYCGLMISFFDRPLSFVEHIPSSLQDLSGEQAMWERIAHAHTLLLEAEFLPTRLDSMVSNEMTMSCLLFQ